MKDNKEIFLNFGKHKGESLKSVPFTYLRWLLTKYNGKSLKKKDLEDEAISRGCKIINGEWSVSLRTYTGWDKDIIFNRLVKINYGSDGVFTQIKDDISDCDSEFDMYELEGMPNTF